MPGAPGPGAPRPWGGWPIGPIGPGWFAAQGPGWPIGPGGGAGWDMVGLSCQNVGDLRCATDGRLDRFRIAHEAAVIMPDRDTHDGEPQDRKHAKGPGPWAGPGPGAAPGVGTLPPPVSGDRCGPGVEPDRDTDANRSERVSQFVRERRQEIVFASIGLDGSFC